jgi:uncharacterized protein
MRIAPVVLGLALLATQPLASAASFDCHAASLAAVEARICAVPALSSLDDRLADAYRQARSADPGVAAEQRRWLRDVRNKCSSDTCLTNAYEARLEALTKDKDKDKGKAEPCPLTEKTLLGDWLNTGHGSPEFDELRFVEYEGVKGFDSFLHQASLAAGTWTLQDCRIHVKGAAEGIDFDFDILGYKHDVVRLRNVDEDTLLEFKRNLKH